MKKNAATDKEKIIKLLSRGVENVYPSREFLAARLQAGKPLTLYLGIDPTGDTLHLGHLIVLRKMREFQDLGHKLILLIGDFTGMIGDPTGKGETRQQLTRRDVLQNAKDYAKQAGQVIAMSGKNKAEIKFNSRWLSKLTLKETIELAAHFTVQRLFERDMFARRVKESKPIYLHEFFYPVLQAFDSVAMDVDGEVGGNDQTFNMLCGRELMKEMKGKEKFVLTTKLLVDSTGKKMGKSEGNMVTLKDPPKEMFGKIMSWPDELIRPGFELLTDRTDEEIKQIEKKMKEGANPRAFKEELAKDVVGFFAGKKQAETEAANFTKQFSKHEGPEEIPDFKLNREANIIDVLVNSGLAGSKSEARRLIDGGGVKLDGHAIEGYDVTIIPNVTGVVIQKGKRHFRRIVKK